MPTKSVGMGLVLNVIIESHAHEIVGMPPWK
jgi:hypothetical protein